MPAHQGIIRTSQEAFNVATTTAPIITGVVGVMTLMSGVPQNPVAAMIFTGVGAATTAAMIEYTVNYSSHSCTTKNKVILGNAVIGAGMGGVMSVVMG